jgi:hypothetical protein
MPEDTLEQVRLLSNLESSRHKLLQIVLFGQPELDATLAKPSLRQLRDRITHGFRMRPLSATEVATYLAFRMRAAGYRGPDVFAARAARLLARISGGLTRRINILADKALLAAYSESSHAVTERHVKAAIADSEFAAAAPLRARSRPALLMAAGITLGLVLGVALHNYWPQPQPISISPSAAVQPPPAANAAAATAEMEAELDLFEEAQAAAQAESEAESGQPLLSAGQLQRLQRYTTGGYKLLSERLSATRELLERAPDGRYALELFVTDKPEPARMERFLLRARDMVPLSEVYLVPVNTSSLRIVYGSFDSEREALDAERRLPPKYQQAFRASPRSFATLRREM